jgi:hypothetical protein
MLLTVLASPRGGLAEELPQGMPPTSVASAPEPALPPAASPAESQPRTVLTRHRWELGGAVFKTLAAPDNNSQIGAARLLIRRFINDSLTVGADFRYWPVGSYPLSDSSDTSAWALGGNGQLYLFRTSHIGAYLGGSLLWVPTHTEAAFAPEAGFKWFCSQRLALGVSYWILTDLGSYTTSFAPPFNGKSRQSLGFEVSVYL